MCGLPQEYVLGILIFLIYVNDMLMAVKCNLYLHAIIHSVRTQYFWKNKEVLAFWKIFSGTLIKFLFAETCLLD